MRPGRVIGYARVSSKEQALGTSLEDQQAVIHRYAKSQGLRVDRMYVEASSAVHERIERREQLQALMVDIREGDLVLVDKVDRWSRDPELTYRTMRQLVERKARAFFIGDNIDPSTNEGDTALNFRVLFAKEEHKRIKERTVTPRRMLRDRGYYAEGRPPLGYRRQATKGLEKNVLVIDVTEAALVRRAFSLCDKGRSLTEIAGLVGIDFTRLGKLLHSRVYLGEILNTEGAWIVGKHPAIVTPGAWSAAQEALAARRRNWSKGVIGERTVDWWLRDVARCGRCGAKMMVSHGSTRGYLGCVRRCTRYFVRRDLAEVECEPSVVARLEALRELLAADVTSAPAAPVDLAARRVKLDTKRARTLDLFTDGAIDRAEYRKRLSVIDGERTRLDALETPAPAPSAARRRELLRRVGVVQRCWQVADGAKRRRLISALVVTVGLVAGQPPRITWRTVEELQKEGV